MLYMINELPDKYRWVSISDNDVEWGIKVAKLRGEKIPEDFGPIPIEWTPETINRPICDFPNFRSNLTCFSIRSMNTYGTLLSNFGVWIKLAGLSYVAFYCLEIIDAMDERCTDEYLDKMGFSSFHSPGFAPVLSRGAIREGVDMFRLPQSISKTFVGERFVKEYSDGSFTGLEFIPVTLI